LIEAGVEGTRLALSGVVLSTSCRPVRGALLDFWQADGRGSYDNEGFRLRGHQRTDARGRFRLETVVPGRYPGRTPHIHVKVQPPGGAVLTTQLYFPGERGNDDDALFDRALLIDLHDAGGDRKRGSFTFVLR
jgi:protocatechuate 3,4-dioxygenase beta subunit